MEFKDILKKLRKDRHLSQAKVAEALNVSVSLIGLYENGVRRPSIQMLEDISDFFNVSMDYLTGKDTEGSTYYINPETAHMAQEIYDNKELKLLFDAARTASPQDLKATHDILLALKRREVGNPDE